MSRMSLGGTEGMMETTEGDIYGKDIPEWVRQKVLRRDNWRCQRCGSDRQLDLHHIDKRSLNPGVHDPDRIVTVCRIPCHRMLENHQLEVRRIGEYFYFSRPKQT